LFSLFGLTAFSNFDQLVDFNKMIRHFDFGIDADDF